MVKILHAPTREILCFHSLDDCKAFFARKTSDKMRMQALVLADTPSQAISGSGSGREFFNVSARGR